MVIHLFRSTLKVRIVYNPPFFLPAANPIPLKCMPYCKLYVSGILVHPSVSGLYHDSATAAALVPSRQTSSLINWRHLLYVPGFFPNAYQPIRISSHSETFRLAWLPRVSITPVTLRPVVTAETSEWGWKALGEETKTPHSRHLNSGSR